MNYTPNDIILKIRLSQDININAQYLHFLLDSLEKSLYESDREDINRIFNKIYVSDIYRDACLERLRKYKNNRINLDDIEKGSFILYFSVTAVSLILAKEVLSQDDAVNPYSYQKFKAEFRNHLESKALYISEKIRKVLIEKKQSSEVKFNKKNDNTPFEITINIESNDRNSKKNPSIGNELDS